MMTTKEIKIGFEIDSDSEEIKFTNGMVFGYMYLDGKKLYTSLHHPIFAKTIPALAKKIARYI